MITQAQRTRKSLNLKAFFVAWAVFGTLCPVVTIVAEPAHHMPVSSSPMAVSAATDKASTKPSNPSAEQAGEELKRIRAQIRAATEAVQTEAAHRDVAAKAVRQADQALQKASHRYEQTKQARTHSEKRLAELTKEAEDTRAQLSDRQSRLSEFVRSAQAAGGSDSVAEIMNGENPATEVRLLEYFGYIGNLRAEEIRSIERQAHHLQELEEQLSGEVKRLSDLEVESKSRTVTLDAAKAERKRSLDQLTNSVANRTQQLKDLKSNAQALENLLERLNRVVRQNANQKKSPDTSVVRGAVAKIRGQWNWPVTGKVLARFGEERIGGLHWTGLLFETRAQSDVRAAAAGRVIYSDWLPGLGQLIIIDHGSGILSLYGYNDSLKRVVGDQVQANDVIAATAQTESGQAKMYFEIREAGKPVDPAAWLSKVK